jgi:hypothetical protein
VTEPGEFAARIAEVPGTLTAMRRAARELVFPYRRGRDFAANGVETSRVTGSWAAVVTSPCCS